MADIKFTKPNEGYWFGTGAYQKEYTRLYDELVPAEGAADTLNGEMMRAVSRLGYEYFNNGNCNAFEVTTVFDPEFDDYVDDGHVSDFYYKLVQLLRSTFEADGWDDAANAASEILEIIEDTCMCERHTFAYNILTDFTVAWVLEHEGEDKPLPAWYAQV